MSCEPSGKSHSGENHWSLSTILKLSFEVLYAISTKYSIKILPIIEIFTFPAARLLDSN